MAYPFIHKNISNIETLGILYAVLVGFIVLIPLSSAHGDEADIFNTNLVTASTGGLLGGNGVTVEGKAESSVFIKTTVNGDVVENIYEVVESGDGDTSIYMKKESHINTSGENDTMETDIQINRQENLGITTGSDNSNRVSEEKTMEEELTKNNSSKISAIALQIENFIGALIQHVFRLFI